MKNNRIGSIDKKFTGVRYNVEQSRNVSIEKLKLTDQNQTMRMINNSFENDAKKNDSQVNYDTIESLRRNKSKQSQNKTSRKGKRRGTNDQFKMYAKPSGIQFQVSPIPSNNIVGIKFQEGMNISHLTN